MSSDMVTMLADTGLSAMTFTAVSILASNNTTITASTNPSTTATTSTNNSMNSTTTTSTTTTNNNGSSGIHNHTASPSLQELSDAHAMEMVAVLVLWGLLLLLGLLGNCLVLYVYGARFKPSGFRTAIVSLAVLDILSCLVAIPGEMIDLRFSFNYPSDAMCRVLRAGATLPSVASGLMLTAVARDRYLLICTSPLSRASGARARVWRHVLLACSTSLVLACPAAVVYGTAEVSAGPRTGWECSTSDLVKDSALPLVYSLVLLAVFLVNFTAMVVLYVLIGLHIYRQGQFRRTLSLVRSYSRTATQSEQELSLVSDAESKHNNGSHSSDSAALWRPKAAGDDDDEESTKKEDPFVSDGERTSPCDNLTTPLCDGLTTSPCDNLTTPLCDGLTTSPCDSLTTPLCDGEKTSPCDNLTTPLCDGEITSPCDNLTTPLCDGTTTPTCDNLTTPLCDGTTTPTCDNLTTPLCDGEKTSPCDNLTTPLYDGEKTSPCDNLTTPLCDGEKTSPCDNLTTSLWDGTTTPPCDNLTPPLCDNLTTPLCDGERTSPCDNLTTPLCDEVTTPPCDNMTPPLCDNLTTPLCESSTSGSTTHARDVGVVDDESTEQADPFGSDGVTTPTCDGVTKPLSASLSRPLCDNLTTPSCDSLTTPPYDSVTTPPCDSGTAPPCDSLTTPSCDSVSTPPCDNVTAPPVPPSSGRVTVSIPQTPQSPTRKLSRTPSALMHRIRRSTSVDAHTRKTTVMLCLISMAFVLSYLPHLAVKLVRKDAQPSAAYHLCARSYFLNSVVNVFIYGFCSLRFRRECRKAVRKLLVWRCCRLS